MTKSAAIKILILAMLVTTFVTETDDELAQKSALGSFLDFIMLTVVSFVVIGILYIMIRFIQEQSDRY